jgi:type I restriction enzyme S subunit
MTNDIKQRIEQINRGEVPQGYKKTEVGIVPNEWESEDTFGDLFDFYGGLGIPRDQLSENGVPYLHYGDMHKEYFTKASYEKYNQLPKYDTKLKGDETYLIQDGDMVFLDASEDLAGTSRCVVIDNPENLPFISGLHTFVAKPKKQALYKEYKQYLTAPQMVQRQFEKLASGFKVYGLNRNTVKQISIAYPRELNEQQNIAEIISKWDEAIELQEKLIAKLEEQKKALMQKLLTPKEGWKEFVLGDLGITYGGLNGKSKSDFGTGKPYITYMNIFSNSIINKDEFEYVAIDENEVQNKAIYGDIFFTTSSETPEEVGFSAVLLENIENLYLNSFCFGFRLNNFETLLPEFAAYYFRSNTFREILKTLAQGATRFNLSKTNLMKNSILLPSVKKQEKFANIFLKTDRLIKLENCKLNSIKQQQKALQQLLLTGIVRV